MKDVFNVINISIQACSVDMFTAVYLDSPCAPYLMIECFTDDLIGRLYVEMLFEFLRATVMLEIHAYRIEKRLTM